MPQSGQQLPLMIRIRGWSARHGAGFGHRVDVFLVWSRPNWRQIHRAKHIAQLGGTVVLAADNIAAAIVVLFPGQQQTVCSAL